MDKIMGILSSRKGFFGDATLPDEAFALKEDANEPASECIIEGMECGECDC